MDHSHPRFNDHINVDALTARRLHPIHIQNLLLEINIEKVTFQNLIESSNFLSFGRLTFGMESTTVVLTELMG
jgi:hypothetical protein